VDRGVYLEFIANNAGVVQQAFTVLLLVGCYFCDLESLVGFLEIFLLLQNSEPGKPGLIDLQNEPLEEGVIVRDGKAIFAIMIGSVEGMTF